ADATCRRAVELLEAEVDAAPVEESEQVWEYVNELSRHPPDGTPIHQMLVADLLLAAGSPPSAVGYLLRSFDDWGDVTGRAAQVATIMRDIVGNPFRPVRADPRWLTSDVLALAASIYAERAFDRLPILADALQDAGCENADVLGHCRDPQLTHVRGCWVVDLVLGKE